MKKKVLASILFMTCLVTIVGCGSNTTTSSSESKMKEDQSEVKVSDEKKTEAKVGLEETQVDVTLDDAIAIYKEKYPDALIHKIKLKKAKGTYVYEIKGYVEDTLHEVLIDANNKEILNAEKDEATIEKDKTSNPLVLDGIVKPADTIKNGFETVKDESIVLGWSIENEGDQILYRLHLKNKSTGVKSDLIIDAKTGNVK